MLVPVTAEPPIARRLDVRLEIDERALHFWYDVDDRGWRALSARYSFDLSDLDAGGAGAIGAGVAVYLAQLCLARTVALHFPVDPATVEELRPIGEMLYGIRCWKDARPLQPAACIRVEDPRSTPPSDRALDAERSVLLFSGGKDSTLAALALQRNRYEVHPLYVSANVHAEDHERRAVGILAGQLGVNLTTVAYRHDDFGDLSRSYARNWDRFPHHNAVPFGRDLALAVLSVPVALRYGAGRVSLGHDHACRNAYVTYGGRRIPRNDIESTQGGVALERYITRFLASELRLLPPLARVSEFRILREMFERHANLMSNTAFCFWGENCGRCGKCLRYFLAQRVFDREGTLEFAFNPLAEGACPELDDILRSWGRESVLFDTEVVYMLGRLVQRGDVRPGEDRLRQFAADLYPSVVDRLTTWERELDAVGTDPQVPADFLPV